MYKEAQEESQGNFLEVSHKDLLDKFLKQT